MVYNFLVFLLLNSILSASPVDNDIAVIGVIASSNPKKSIIMIHFNNKVRTLRIGQFFGNRYRVKDIVNRYVIIEDSNYKIRQLLIGQNSTVGDLKVINQESYDTLVGTDYSYPVGYYAFANPPRSVYRYFHELSPYYIDEEFGPFGFTLTGSLFNGLGLRVNDVLLEYNGTELSNYDGISKMLHDLGNKEEVHLSYLRNGIYKNLRLILE